MRVVVVTRIAPFGLYVEHVGYGLLDAAAPDDTARMNLVVIIAWSQRTAGATRNVRHKLLALLATNPTNLAVDKSARHDFHTCTGSKAPFFKGLMVCDASTVVRVVLSRRPPERTFCAEDEVVRNVGVNASGCTPANLRFAVAFRMKAADAALSFDAEAAKPLGIGLCGRHPHNKRERRNNAGMQSPHDCNPFC